jgi:hypothetical protein
LVLFNFQIMLDTFFLILGIILSASLIYCAWLVHYKSHKFRDTIKSYNSKNYHDELLKEVYKNFEEIAEFHNYLLKDEVITLKFDFEKQLEKELKTNHFRTLVYDRKNDLILNSIQKIHFQPHVILNLQNKNKKVFAKNSATIYGSVIKIIIISYYVKRKQDQFDINVSEQSYKLENYNLRLREGITGVKEISIE